MRAFVAAVAAARRDAASAAPTDRFGAFGGRYVPETLIPALDELERGVRIGAWPTRRFGASCDELASQVCRPSVAAERSARVFRSASARSSGSSAKT